jgi:hypothetical protein
VVSGRQWKHDECPMIPQASQIATSVGSKPNRRMD